MLHTAAEGGTTFTTYWQVAHGRLPLNEGG